MIPPALKINSNNFVFGKLYFPAERNREIRVPERFEFERIKNEMCQCKTVRAISQCTFGQAKRLHASISSFIQKQKQTRYELTRKRVTSRYSTANATVSVSTLHDCLKERKLLTKNGGLLLIETSKINTYVGCATVIHITGRYYSANPNKCGNFVLFREVPS